MPYDSFRAWDLRSLMVGMIHTKVILICISLLFAGTRCCFICCIGVAMLRRWHNFKSVPL
jgi:hypothetical protein